MSNQLTTKQAAETFHYTPGYLRILRHEGKGPPFIKLGGKVYYDPAAFAEWVAGRQK